MKTVNVRDLQHSPKKILDLLKTEPEIMILRKGIPFYKIVPLSEDSNLIKEQWRVDRMAEIGKEVPVASSYPMDDDLGNIEGFEQEITEKDDFFRSELLKEDNEKNKR